MVKFLKDLNGPFKLIENHFSVSLWLASFLFKRFYPRFSTANDVKVIFLIYEVRDFV